ncbi:Similar to wdn: Serendipity locus protein H-1 (Drosophila melanogaster) [Cotesia congregata]|uniref:Similar to wdn: Serendipity locus protein H-1 (Drosophila melanogaster) n=1 Tax=Cotesia congregata TaxID=51543 RepID=A0A8J2HL95_COTCN|nr:Similar to wdn: Serendipity locus protein H-1 (Drosophila melanogaster) [Cotesia congregata]
MNGNACCDLNKDELLQCRICAEYISDKNDVVNIFDEDAKCNHLQTKIRKYLYILVSSEDRLPKIVCSMCIKRLENIHHFVTLARRAQDKLKLQYYGRDDSDIKQINDNDDGKRDKGFLLRSILNRNEIDESHLSVRPIEDESILTEEMEVKVDPMIFLQCGLDRSITPESEYNSDDDKSYTKDSLSANEEPKNYSSNLNEDSEEDDEPEPETEDQLLNKQFNCTLCSRTFESQMNLQNHLWSHIPRAECHYDDSKSISSLNINNNTPNNGVLMPNTSDNSSGSFVCPICNKNISTKGNLKVHLETHRPKGKYGCDICGRIFKTQSNLYRHKEYHGGIQFPCSVCGRVYPTNSTLRAHSITHSDLRPHACPLCDKTFKRNQDLKFHINQHTGARPYQCPYCPKAFASSGNCFSHRKRMHPKEVHRDRQRAADLMR